jgi:hypothetical protein
LRYAPSAAAPAHRSPPAWSWAGAASR